MLRIDEFSRLGRVSLDRLHRYADLGVLRPSAVHPVTGVRSYQVGQLHRLNAILTLEGLGFTLEQLVPMLDDDLAPRELRAMLERRRADAMSRLEVDASRLRSIDSRIDAIALDPLPNTVVVKSLPEQPYLGVRLVCPTADHRPGLLRHLTERRVGTVPTDALGPITVIEHGDEFRATDIDLEIGVALTRPLAVDVEWSGDQRLTVRTLPDVPRAATAVRIGDANEGHAAYVGIARWLEAQLHVMAGPIREVVLEPPEPGSPERAVTEIQVVVAPV